MAGHNIHGVLAPLMILSVIGIALVKDRKRFFRQHQLLQKRVILMAAELKQTSFGSFSSTLIIVRSLIPPLFLQVNDSRARVHNNKANESLVFDFDKTEIPYLEIWHCYGGWPEDGEERSCTVDWESTNAQTVSLSGAIRNGEAAMIKSNMIHH